MGRKAKIPSAKLIWNGFLHVTVRTLNSYEQTTNSGISRKAGPLFYANNEPKSALARDLGDCRDNKFFFSLFFMKNFLFYGMFQ